MYEIREEQGSYAVYCAGEKIDQFESKQEAETFLNKKTEYNIQDKKIDATLLID